MWSFFLTMFSFNAGPYGLLVVTNSMRKGYRRRGRRIDREEDEEGMV
jgi:hypothetical protein